MTLYNLIDTNAPRVIGGALAVAERIDGLVQSIKDAGIRRRALRELEALSDKQLDDIGIPRYAIRQVVEAKFLETTKAAHAAKAARRQERQHDCVVVGTTEFVT